MQQRATSGVAVIHLGSLPDGAWVSVDGRPRGTPERLGSVLLVDAGTRRLMVEAAGFLTYRADLSLIAGEEYDLAIELWPCFADVEASCVTETLPGD